MTPETKEQVIQDYLSGMPIKEIGAKYHIDVSVPGKLTRKAGFPGRQRVEAKVSAKACPKCREKTGVKGARFCPFAARIYAPKPRLRSRSWRKRKRFTDLFRRPTGTTSF